MAGMPAFSGRLRLLLFLRALARVDRADRDSKRPFEAVLVDGTPDLGAERAPDHGFEHRGAETAPFGGRREGGDGLAPAQLERQAVELPGDREGAGVAPQRVTPSGRSLYVPLEDAKTKEARQKNRRTEIILTPKLDELFQILESA